MESFHLHVMCTRIGAMNLHCKRALTPSPSPIRPWLRRRLRRGEWERVAAGRVRGRFMGSWHLLVHANWGLELKSNVAAEVTRYTLSLSKGSDLLSDERVGVE